MHDIYGVRSAGELSDIAALVGGLVALGFAFQLLFLPSQFDGLSALGVLLGSGISLSALTYKKLSAKLSESQEMTK